MLGNLPDRPQPSQKWFESLLLHELDAFDAARAVFVEGESKKIGQLQVPEALIERMRASRCILLDTAMEARVSLLLQEYRHFVEDPPVLAAQLDCLVGLHGRGARGVLYEAHDQGVGDEDEDDLGRRLGLLSNPPTAARADAAARLRDDDAWTTLST